MDKIVSVYIDESGDLGWKFDALYRKGGSSRYLTIAAILIAHSQRHHLKRLMRQFYKKTKTVTDTEIKWASLSSEQREWIAHKLVELKQKLQNYIQFLSISVKKESVALYARQDSYLLYSYMAKQMLVGNLLPYREANLNIDQRTIKLKSERSLHDYLQTELWFAHSADVHLVTKHCDSKHDLGVQLADILSGIVQSHFEDSKSGAFSLLSPYCQINKLYFD
ncbi:DUF3800 domain-containing protein [Pelistega suis]|uniref:DUF3800 domain-containing protein n=1 Tax=Pelistega suis TaxID=1631957 RepID=UPI00211C6EC1|nr:DUF3800 domain-containing protein [Pelistega suis]MCQ9328645.1 DUF3800 domain-containing protein [Pelistega suis]